MTPVATDAPGGLTQPEVVERLQKACEAVREAEAELRGEIDARNELVRQAIDLYLLSHRQVARATGLSLGRIHGILAND